MRTIAQNVADQKALQAAQRLLGQMGFERSDDIVEALKTLTTEQVSILKGGRS